MLANQNFIATTSNFVFKRSLAREIGGFSDFRYVHDWDFAIRASLQTRGLYVPHFLSLYRDHGKNTIKSTPEVVRKEVCVLFRGLMRDFPDLADRPGVHEALAGNAYLAGEPWLPA